MALHKLNQKKVNDLLTKPGRYSDGGGLYAQVTADGGSWVFRYKRGRERWMGLGPLDDVALEEARDNAAVARKQLRQGLDPLDVKAEQRDTPALEAAKRIGFETVANQLFKSHEAKWSNAVYRKQFLSSLTAYASNYRKAAGGEGRYNIGPQGAGTDLVHQDHDRWPGAYSD